MIVMGDTGTMATSLIDVYCGINWHLPIQIHYYLNVFQSPVEKSFMSLQNFISLFCHYRVKHLKRIRERWVFYDTSCFWLK